MKVEFYNYGNGYTEVYVSGDTPCILGDKLRGVINDFYKEKK